MRCRMQVWTGLDKMVGSSEEISTEKALKMVRDYRNQAIYAIAKSNAEHALYQVIERDEELDIITVISYFKNTFLTDKELLELSRRLPNAEFGVIHGGYKKACEKVYNEEKSKRIRPVTLKEANNFVKANHRHNGTVTGCRFAIGLTKFVKGREKLIGVAICGRPVSRVLDNGLTLEINRLCTTEGGNSCSMLYSAAVRIAKEMGYKKVITYTTASEEGASLRASGFTLDLEGCGGIEWTGKRAEKQSTFKKAPRELKKRWVRTLA